MILADRDLARDAVQQVFVKTIKLGRRIRKITALSDYLRIAVRNECYSIIRKRRNYPDNAVLDQNRIILEGVDDALVDLEEKRQLEKALNKLPPAQRETLHLRVYEEKTFKEISAVTGDSINTINSRYRYAVKRLKEMLDKDNYDASVKSTRCP